MVERYGMIDEASGHAPLYFGRTTDLPPHGVSGEEYVRHSDYAALEAERQAAVKRAEAAEAEVSRLTKEAAEVIKPFAAVSSTFDFAIAPDGIDDGIGVVLRPVVGPDREAVLSTSHFSDARAWMQKNGGGNG